MGRTRHVGTSFFSRIEFSNFTEKQTKREDNYYFEFFGFLALQFIYSLYDIYLCVEFNKKLLKVEQLEVETNTTIGNNISPTYIFRENCIKSLDFLFFFFFHLSFLWIWFVVSKFKFTFIFEFKILFEHKKFSISWYNIIFVCQYVIECYCILLFFICSL